MPTVGAEAAPALSVTKTDTLLADADADGLADPGDALRYTLVVDNSGTTDALGVVVSDTLDANTILSGTVRASPVAVSDSYTTTIEKTLVVNPSTGLLANDFGLPAPIVELPPGLPVVATTQGGSATLATNGSFQYVPPADYVGPDSFTYTAYNPSGSAPGQVALMVLDVPVAEDDVYDTIANTPLVVPGGTGVLANDTPNFSAISAYAHVSAQGGSVSLAPDGSFSYTPPVDFFSPPTDTFTYTLSNDAGADTATVSITINLPGSPEAVNDVYTTTVNTPRTVPAPGVLANDTPNLGTITAYAHTSVRGGSVTLNANGGFTYTPPEDTVSPPTDTFTYTVSNALGASTATVSFTLYPPGPPAAANDAYTATLGVARVVAAPGVLGNDTVNYATITSYQSVTSRGGSVTLTASGAFTYSAPAGVVSPPNDTFTYTLSNMLGTHTGLVTLTIYPNGPPIANNDRYTTTVNTPLAVPAPGLLGNDNLNFGQLAGYAATTTRGGTVVVAASGAFTYTPPANQVRPPLDSFTYTVTNTVGADTATVSLAINPPGPPSAADDAYDATANLPLNVPAGSGVLANDIRNFAAISAYDHETDLGGQVSVNLDGSFTYTPPDDEVSPPDDSFGYTLTNALGSDSATVTITILPPGPPVAANDAYTATAGAARVVAAPGVLGNDTRNFGTITSYQASTSRGGSVTLNANGGFTYTPPAGFVSPPTDTFTYTLSNALGADVGLVTLTVFPGGPPAANNDLYTTTVNTTLVVPAPGLFGNDTLNFGQLAGYAAVTARGGTVTVGAAGGFTYTPPANQVRPPLDTFTYTVTNTVGADTATVSIAINPAGLPNAANDAYTTTVNMPLTRAAPGVLGNDTLNFGALAPFAGATSQGGSVNLAADGSFTYTPPDDEVSPPDDSFSYTLTSVLGSDNATVTITILPASVPAAVDDAYDATAGQTLSVTPPGVLGNDTRSFGTITSYQAATSRGGSVTLNGNGGFSYTPPAGVVSPPNDTFTYTLSNALGADTATVTLTVYPSGPPVASNDLYTTTANTALVVGAPGLLGNDTPNFGTITRYQALTSRGGSVALNANGGFTYTPPADTVRPPNDSFTYTVTNTVGADTATVSIAINPAGLPVAADDAYDATANTALSVPAGSGVAVNDTLNFATISDYDDETVRGGSVSLGADGGFTYTPPDDVVSPPDDSFNYTLTNILGSDSATVTITILPASAPVAADDAYDATAGSTLDVPAPGVLDNDTLQFGTLTPFGGATSQGGSVTLNADGSFSYTPPDGFVSPPADGFSYTLTNALGGSTGTVSLTVLAGAGQAAGRPGGAKAAARAAHDLAADAAVVSVGRLPVDRSVTLYVDAIIANPLLPGTSEITNQAEVRGGNFGPLRSDDPTTPAANDATITQLDGLSAERQYLPVVMRNHATGPDLVGGFSLSPDQSTYSAGQPVVITVIITNVGTTRAGPFWVDFYLNPSTPPTQAGQVWDSLCALSPCYGLAWQVTASLAPGQSVTLSSAPGSFYGPNSNWPGHFASGTSDLYLYVDSYDPGGSPAGLVVETNEGNNRAERHGLSVP